VSYWTYILCNKLYGTLYVGMTSDLPGRTYQHREGLADGFTKNMASSVWCISSGMKPRSLRLHGRKLSNAGRAIGRLR
jgi:predicted GIY-YIG superfamily endonuclease